MERFDYNGDPYKMIDENFKLKLVSLLGESEMGVMFKCQELKQQ